MELDKYISQAVKVRMVRDNVSQMTLARKSHVAQGTLSQYFSGKFPWKLKSIEKVAKALGWHDSFDLMKSGL